MNLLCLLHVHCYNVCGLRDYSLFQSLKLVVDVEMKIVC